MENKAKYQVSSAMNRGILEIVVTGEVTKSTYEKVVNEVNALVKANNAVKVIADCRAVAKRIKPLELYNYFRNYDSTLFYIRSAIVDLPENAEYKTAIKDAGVSSLMWCTDIDAARKWIQSK